jgi:hypothetical protein
MVCTIEYLSNEVRVKHTVTKNEHGPESVQEFLDRAEAEFQDFVSENPPD